MCGLSGACGLKPNRFKLHILGIWNETRGIHSAGLFIKDRLFKEPGLYRDLVSTLDFNEEFYDEDQRVILQHTRAATYGAKTKDNAHPFQFSNDERTLTIMHNGSLEYLHSFREKFKVDKKYDVDSQTLGHAIFHNPKKLSNILKSYKGAAALAWNYSDEVDTLYLWKGASRKYKVDKDLTEERPLFYYYDTVDSCMYFSSIEKSLEVIKENKKDKIYKVPNNKILTFKEGKLIRTSRVKRVGIVYEAYVPVVHSRTHIPYQDTTSQIRQLPINFNNQDRFKPTNPSSMEKGNYYWFMGRYYRNGHPADGKIIIKDRKEVYKEYEGTTYYFYKGYWLAGAKQLKDLRTRSLNIAQLQNNCFEVLLENSSKQAYIVNSKGVVFNNKRKFKGGAIIPFMCSYKYSVNDAGNIISESINKQERKVEIIKDLLPEVNEEKDSINKMFLANFKEIYNSIEEATALSLEYQDQLDLDNFDRLENLKNIQLLFEHPEYASELETFFITMQ